MDSIVTSMLMSTEDKSQMQMISWGIIGCGNVTELKSGPAFSKVPNSRLHAVMRRDAVKAADYARRHGISHWYSDAYALMDDPEVNAIYIATPPKQHEEYAVEALKRGKSVYVEKPVALNTAACKRIAEVVRSTGGKLVVAHYRRAIPMFKHIMQIIWSGKLGRIKSIQLQMFQPHNNSLIASAEENWRVVPDISGGGYFYDLAPHQLDILQYIFGNPVQYHGIAVQQSKHYPAEDAVTGVIEYPNQIIMNGQWHFDMPDFLKEDSCIIMGESGSIEFPFFGNTISYQSPSGVETLSFDHPAHIQQPMIEEVVRYFRGEADNPCTVEEALISLSVMEKFVYSTTIIGP